MDYIELGEPCRNYNFLSEIMITDPKDKREKLVLCTFAAGNVGRIIFLDPERGEGARSTGQRKFLPPSRALVRAVYKGYRTAVHDRSRKGQSQLFERHTHDTTATVRGGETEKDHY